MLFRVNRKPFEVAVQGLSSFGGKKPRAVVANIAPSRPLIELQAELERMMQRIGLDPEGRKFTPHVTLARLRDASNQDVADYLSVRGYFPTKVFMASRFVLFSSRASVGGGPYVVEDSYALSA
jgi:2'-5' RNA ligase